jgi:hypothetical protein
LKHISNAVWETLSKSRFANEILAWDGEESGDDIFLHHQKAQEKKIAFVE